MSFSGFSEDEIRKLSKANDINKTQKAPVKNSLKKVTFKPNHNAVNPTKNKTTLNNNVSTMQDLPQDAKLTVNKEKANVESVKVDVVISQQDEENKEKKENKKYKDLDEFEAKQKLIEEQNRKRKELLAKALADRTKRTQEEAQRLNEIQVEFKKLDAILSNDVKILRKQIELASIDYNECQKRYHKIEKEFLDAKFLLHQKQEKKEMLTEHLCAIIEKNEERKAEKLNELLMKLELTPNEIVCNKEDSVKNEEKAKETGPETPE